jgi:hypothetical protein
MPVTPPLAAVQQAIYQRLAGDSALVAALAASPSHGAGIYDEPPAGARCPYLQLEGFLATPRATYGRGVTGGAEVSGQVKVVSTYPGDREAEVLADQVMALLNYPAAPLLVTDWPDCETWVESVGPLYTELVGSVVVRHLPIIVRVQVYAA